MPATLPQGVSNTYYGRWTARTLRHTGRIDRSIAHDDGAARVKFAVVAARRRVLPANRRSTAGNLHRPEEEFLGAPVNITTASRWQSNSNPPAPVSHRSRLPRG